MKRASKQNESKVPEEKAVELAIKAVDAKLRLGGDASQLENGPLSLEECAGRIKDASPGM
ncbi:MAG TPA: hypothetical protein VIE90_20890 [Candidatus Binatia bacterium]